MIVIQPVEGDRQPKHQRGPVTVELRDLALFKELLRDHDMTLRELAQTIGCSTGHARHIHCGHVVRVSLRLARKIEKALGCHGRMFAPLPEPDQSSGDHRGVSDQADTAQPVTTGAA